MASITEKIRIGRDHNAVDSFGVLERMRRNVLTDTSVLSSVLAKVPVVVLLAMSPALMNSAAAMQEGMVENGNKIEVVSPVSTSRSDAATYVMVSPKSVDETAPAQSVTRPWLQPSEKVVYQRSFVANGVRYNIEGSSKIDDKTITKLLFVPEGFKQVKTTIGLKTLPPRFTRLVFHDNGNDDEAFLGVILDHFTSDANGSNPRNILYEMRLPSDVGMELFKLLSGEAGYKIEGLLRLNSGLYITESMELKKTEIEYRRY